MLSKLIVGTLTAATSLAAVAQSSVTIYGLVDLGVASEDVGASGTCKTLLVGGAQGGVASGFAAPRISAAG